MEEVTEELRFLHFIYSCEQVALHLLLQIVVELDLHVSLQGDLLAKTHLGNNCVERL